MANRTEDDFRDGSKDLIGTLYEAAIEGVRDYHRDHPLVNHKHRVTTRRSIVRDYIVFRLRSAFDAERGTAIVEKNGTTYFGINSQFIGLVRKLSNGLSVALNDTQTTMRFQANVTAPSLPGDGFQGATNVYIGYIPDQRDPMNPRVYVVCPNKSSYDWAIELKPGATGVLEATPITPPGGTDPEILVNVKVVETPKATEDNE